MSLRIAFLSLASLRPSWQYMAQWRNNVCPAYSATGKHAMGAICCHRCGKLAYR